MLCPVNDSDSISKRLLNSALTSHLRSTVAIRLTIRYVADPSNAQALDPKSVPTKFETSKLRDPFQEAPQTCPAQPRVNRQHSVRGKTDSNGADRPPQPHAIDLGEV